MVLEGETDVLTAHIVVEDRYLQKPDKIKKSIKRELENIIQNTQHSN
jgi:cobalt-zinc-cadmium efflux system protein